jgi:hypothetical protein
MQPRLHRGHRLAHDLRHLLARELLHVPEDQHDAIVGGQTLDRRADDAAPFLGQQGLVRHL